MTGDPYKYFRIEALELREAMGRAVLDLEASPADIALVARILRLAHTLKGAARVVKLIGIADDSHAIEEALAPHRDRGSPVPSHQVTEILRLVDHIADGISAIDRSPAPSPVAAVTPVEADLTRRPHRDPMFETVRVEVEQMDRLLESITLAAVEVTELDRDAATLQQARRLAAVLADQTRPRRGETHPGDAIDAAHRGHALAIELREAISRVERRVSAGVEQVRGELAQIRAATNRLRLLPATTLFASLERVARDAALATDRKIELFFSGGDVRLDAHVLATLQGALAHVVRNAVSHGVEPELKRVALGKPARGRIELKAERRGDKVAFVCQDDGQGVDVQALGRAAVRAGVLGESDRATLTQGEAIRLLLRGGLSTAASVTAVAGRGIGLDVVREAAERLRGVLTMSSDWERGTTVEVCVPVSLSAERVLLVQSASSVAALPLEKVRRTLRIDESDVARSGDGESVLYEGQVIPFLPLQSVLGRHRPSARRFLAWSAVVLEVQEGLAAIGVDSLLGTEEVVMRPLPPDADADDVVAGASLDAEGNPQLVLDPRGLVAAARRQRAISTPAERLAPILVIDDSLTTRMLEQSILESAGYEVELAVSAEEGLEMAAKRRYSLFIVDVEMPGLSGFDFVERTRRDPALGRVPAILVTSRASAQDKLRGQEAGAQAYIVKGEFDQGLLLRSIRSLQG